MHKCLKIISAIFLFYTCSSAFSAHCPAASEWSHIKGNAWTLSTKSQSEGWQPTSYDGAIDNELTELPADKHLLIGVSATAHRFTTCGYSLVRGDHTQVIAAINDSDAADIKKLQPPFHCVPYRCFCETTAGNPDACVWQWK